MVQQWIISLLFGSTVFAADGTWLATLPDFDLPSREDVAQWFPEQAPVPMLLREGVVTGFGGVRTISGVGVQGLGLGYQTGLSLTCGPASWPVRPLLAWHHVEAKGDHPELSRPIVLGIVHLDGFPQRAQREFTCDEFALGITRSWRWGDLCPSLAAGAAWTQASLSERPSFTVLRQLLRDVPVDRRDSASTFGGWAAAGLQIGIGAGAAGIEVRYSYTQLTLLNDAVAAGGLQYGATAAWSW